MQFRDAAATTCGLWILAFAATATTASARPTTGYVSEDLAGNSGSPIGTLALTLAVSTCGNGIVEATEQCDDGDTAFTFGDYCSQDCVLVSCGRPTNTTEPIPTANDALFTLRVSAGLSSCAKRVCDANGSGDITAVDALRILWLAVGVRGALHCQGGGYLTGTWIFEVAEISNDCPLGVSIPSFRRSLSVQHDGNSLLAFDTPGYSGNVGRDGFSMSSDWIDYVSCDRSAEYDAFLYISGTFPPGGGPIAVTQRWGLSPPTESDTCPPCDSTWTGTISIER